MSCHRWSRAEFTAAGVEARFAPDLALEPVHLDVALRFDLPGRRAEGQVTTTVRCRHPGRRALELDACDLEDLAVAAPDGRELAWSYDGRKVRIRWAEPFAVDERRTVAVRYRVEDPVTGMLFQGPDEAYPGRPLMVATDHETERARYWLPCLDHPAVRTTLDLRLRADARHTVLANGARVGEEAHDDGTRTVRWRLDSACPSYLVCLAIGDLVRWDGPAHGEVPVAAFAPAPYTAADLERSFRRTTEMLDWLTNKLAAPFPFPKYYQVVVPQVGGAMENISLVTWDDAFVLDETLAREWTRLVERINVHEMAHSYFGDAIVIRDFAHAWLKESWATYVEALWIEDQLGEEELLYHLHCEARDYQSESDTRYARPIVTHRFESSWDMFDQHLYPGGAWRLHMLRRRVGDDAFFGAAREYVRRHSGGTVETADLRRVLEERSGLSLGRFFAQWLESPGYPKLKVDFAHDAERGLGRLTVEQAQVDRKKGIGTFDLGLEVAFETADGEWRVETVELREAKHSVSVSLAARPLQVVIDPRSAVLAALEFNPGDDMLRRSLAHCPHLPGRLHAIRALARTGRRANVAALRQAAAREEFWGARAAIARELGAAKSRFAAEALAELLGKEDDPLVLATLAEACGSYREEAVARALRRFLERADLPYQARAAALRALGKQRREEDLDLLARATEDASWWGWVRRGAVQGLGAHRSERARQLLLGKVGYGSEAPQVRQAALPALAEAARWQDRPAREATRDRLADLGRDPEYRVRAVAARALGVLAEQGSAASLEGIAASLAEQDVPRVRRIADRLRRAGPGREVDKLRRQTDELQGKLRKLEQRLQLLESRDRGSEGESPPPTVS